MPVDDGKKKPKHAETKLKQQVTNIRGAMLRWPSFNRNILRVVNTEKRYTT